MNQRTQDRKSTSSFPPALSQLNAGYAQRPSSISIFTFLLGAAIVALWLRGWLPQFITLLQLGRQATAGLQTTSFSEISSLTSTLLAYIVIAFSLVIIIGKSYNFPTLIVSFFAPALLLWLTAVFLNSVLRGESLAPLDFAFPMILISVALLKPEFKFIVKLLFWLVLLSATLSLIFAAASPLAFMSDGWTTQSDKALVGDRILAGIYSHSNGLGLTLTLGIPLIVYATKSWARIFSLTLVLVALVASSSRTSLIISALVLLLVLVTAKMSDASARKIFITVAFLVTIAIVVIPFVFNDPLALTGRGNIWMNSVEMWKESPWFGLGPDIFRTENFLTTTIRYIPSSGHNTFITTLTTAGIVGVTLLLTLLYQLTRRSLSLIFISRIPILMVLTLMLISMTEDGLGMLRFNPHSFLTFTIIAVLLSSAATLPVGAKLPSDNKPK